MLLKKCCCCCNLKYGYFAYGILTMAARLITLVSLYHASNLIISVSTDPQATAYIAIFATTISIYGGWVITSAVCLFFTLKGIVQDRPILMYPYIVILVVELIGAFVSGIFSAILATAYYLILLPFVAAIMICDLWSLISLYKQMKNNPSIPYMADLTVMKTV